MSMDNIFRSSDSSELDTTSASEVDDSGEASDEPVYSPLFTEANQNGELPLAKDIAKIKISRVFLNASGKVQRIPVPKAELRNSDGSVWEIDKYKHEEEDIGEQLGGGTFFIQPIDRLNRRLPCGRTFIAPGRPRYRNLHEMETALGAMTSGSEPDRTTFGRPEDAVLNDTIRRLEDRIEGLAKASGTRDTSGAREIAQVAVSRDEASGEAIRSLREEISRLQSDHSRDMAERDRVNSSNMERLTRSMEAEREACRKQVEEARDSSRKQVDEARDEYRAKMRSNDAEKDRDRARSDKEIEELKTTQREQIAQMRAEFDRTAAESTRLSGVRERDAEKRCDEERERRIRDVDDAKKDVDGRIREAVTRAERRVRELETDLNDVRKRLTDENEKLRAEKLELEEENISILKEMAEKSASDGEPPPPPPPSVMSGSEAPWFVTEGKGLVKEVLEAIAKARQAQAQAQAAQAQAAQAQAAQAQQQQQPMQQFAPPPQQFQQPVYAPPPQPRPIVTAEADEGDDGPVDDDDRGSYPDDEQAADAPPAVSGAMPAAPVVALATAPDEDGDAFAPSAEAAPAASSDAAWAEQ